MKKKRKRYLWVCIGLALVFLALCAPAASALTPEEIPGRLREILPDAARQTLPEELGTENSEEVSRAVGIRAVLASLLSILQGELPGSIGVLLSLLGVTVFFAVGGVLRSDSPGENGEMCDRIITVAASLAMLHILGNIAGDVVSYLGDIVTMTNGMAPLYGALYAAGGSAATAVTSSATLTLMGTVLQNACAGVLLPLVRVSFGLMLAGNIGRGVPTESIGRQVRSVYTTLLALICTLMTASLAFQTTLTSGSDSIAGRAAKFAFGSIPLVGGTVNATLQTLSASLSYLKGLIGAAAYVSVLLLALPPLIRLYLVHIALDLCASAAGALGSSRGERLFRDTRGIVDMLLAVVIVSALMMILSLTVFSKCATALLQ